MLKITRLILVSLLLCATFAVAQTPDTTKTPTARATGIGGIFFKAKDPASLKSWYATHLGMPTDQYGTMFEFRDAEPPHETRYLQWSVFNEKTTYFAPSEREFMINYRVNDLVTLLEQLRAAGVEIVDTVESYSYGKFVHVMDPEGNKLELWEPPQDTTATFEGETSK